MKKLICILAGMVALPALAIGISNPMHPANPLNPIWHSHSSSDNKDQNSYQQRYSADVVEPATKNVKGVVFRCAINYRPLEELVGAVRNNHDTLKPLNKVRRDIDGCIRAGELLFPGTKASGNIVLDFVDHSFVQIELLPKE